MAASAPGTAALESLHLKACTVYRPAAPSRPPLESASAAKMSPAPAAAPEAKRNAKEERQRLLAVLLAVTRGGHTPGLTWVARAFARRTSPGSKHVNQTGDRAPVPWEKPTFKGCPLGICLTPCFDKVRQFLQSATYSGILATCSEFIPRRHQQAKAITGQGIVQRESSKQTF